jgi:hypothetical protein
MTLRHAAALALVGWYLMVPMPGNDPIPNAEVRSFAKWIHVHSFDSADTCEAGKIRLIRSGLKPFELGSYPEQEVKKVLLIGRCIASDDPRLKEK